jgi:hypothetical protein
MDKILALFLDRFKAANPRVWAIMVVILVVIKYAITQGNLYGLIPIDSQIQPVMDWLAYAVALLIGSRTTAILAKDTISPQMQIADVLQTDLADITAKHSELLDNFSVLSDTHLVLQKELQDKTQKINELEAMSIPREITTTPSKHGGFRVGSGRKPKK